MPTKVNNNTCQTISRRPEQPAKFWCEHHGVNPFKALLIMFPYDSGKNKHMEISDKMAWYP